MAQQIINVSTPDSGTGTNLRNSFIICNDNFTELYASSGGVTDLTTANSTYVNLVDSGTASQPVLTASLSASGAKIPAHFLRGDNTWNTAITSITAGTGLDGGTITTTGTIDLAATAVTPGAYTNANITVDQQGRITAAADGSSGGGTAVNFENLPSSLGDQTLMGSISLDGFNTQTVYTNYGGVSSAVNSGSDIEYVFVDLNVYKTFGTYHDGTAIKAYYEGSKRSQGSQYSSITLAQDPTFPQTYFDFSNAQYPWFSVDWTGIGTALSEATIKLPTSYSTNVPNGETKFIFEGFATVNISNVKSIIRGNNNSYMKLLGGTNGAGGQTVIKFPDLISMSASMETSIYGGGGGYSLELPKLENAQDINFYGDQNYNSYFFQNGSCSELKYIGSLVDGNNLTLPVLTNGVILYAGSISISDAKDATMTFPKLISLGVQAIDVMHCPNLTLFSIGTTNTLKAISYAMSQYNQFIRFNNCPLLNAAGIADFIITLANVESNYTPWCNGVTFDMNQTAVNSVQEISSVSAAAATAVTTLQNNGMIFNITP